MALTITEPFGTGTNFLYTRGWIMVSMTSTNVGQPNFRFCIRFYPTGAATGNYIFLPYLTTGNYLNVAELADNVVGWDRSLFATAGALVYPSLSNPQVITGNPLVYVNTNAVTKYTLEISEGYDVAGVFTIDAGTTVTYPAYYLKGRITARQSGEGTAAGDYYPPATASVNEGWLTWRTYINSPWVGQLMYAAVARAICVPTFTGHKFSIAHINDDGTILAGCIAATYRYTLYEGSVTLATQDYTIPYSPASTTAREKMLYVGVGLDNIEATDVAIIPAIEKPSNFPDWTHYTVQLIGGVSQASQVLCMYRCDCDYQPITLRWVADHGGVEHHTFDGANSVTEDTQRVQVYNHGQTTSGAIYARLLGDQTGYSETTQTLELKSEMLTVEQRKFLATAYRSESLEITTSDGYTYPVTLAEASHRHLIREDFALDTITIKLKIGSDAGTYL